MPLVSVILPVYNGEAYIEACLESVFTQTYPEIELIVVDDGSEDSTLEFIQKYPGKIKILQQNHGDVSEARNRGIKASAGAFIAFIDQDDTWAPEKIAKQAGLMQSSDADLVFTDLIKFWDDGRTHHARDKHRIALSLTDKNLFRKLVMKNVLMPSAVMVRRESLERSDLFDTQFTTCGDYELWLRMAGMKMRFRYLPESLTWYRQHSRNTCKNTTMMHADRIRALEKTFASETLPSEFKRLERQALANAYRFGAHTFYSVRDYKAFLNAVKTAWRLNGLFWDWKLFTRLFRVCIKRHKEKQ